MLPTRQPTPEETAADPSLHLADVYRRQVRASVERIWENVFDWEHLPALHGSYFTQVERLDSDESGWRLRLSRPPGTPDRMQVLDLTADRENCRYTVLTAEGIGAGTRFWVQMTPVEPHVTDVEVRYYVPEAQPERLERLGSKYRASCERLWSEDEAMMVHRQRMLDRAGLPRPLAEPIALGHEAALRARLPIVVEQGGRPFRIVELDGAILAHSTVCPHWLGPLDAAPVEDGLVTCPWHGWKFDIRSGGSADGHDLRLYPAPSVVVDAAGEATLVPAPRRARQAA